MAKERNQRGYHPVSYFTEDTLFQTMVAWTFDTKKLVLVQKTKDKPLKKPIGTPRRPAPPVQHQPIDVEQISFAF